MENADDESFRCVSLSKAVHVAYCTVKNGFYYKFRRSNVLLGRY